MEGDGGRGYTVDSSPAPVTPADASDADASVDDSGKTEMLEMRERGRCRM